MRPDLRARDLPHRVELHALVGALWTMAQSGGVYLGGYSLHTGGLCGKNLHAMPETGMVLEDLKARQPGLRWEETCFRIEGDCGPRAE